MTRQAAKKLYKMFNKTVRHAMSLADYKRLLAARESRG